MIFGISLAFVAYSLYCLFSSTSGNELALALVRTAVAAVLVALSRGANGIILSTIILMNVAVVLTAMELMRKEVQLKDDER
jgi:hypothetical protein